MKLWAKIDRILKGWLLMGVDKADDPEAILGEAKEMFEHELGSLKANAVTVIGRRNALRQRLWDDAQCVAQLAERVRRARRWGDDAFAGTLDAEIAVLQAAIVRLEEELQEAEQAVEEVKQSIRDLESQVLRRAAERLALIAGWHQARIQDQLDRALVDQWLRPPGAVGEPRTAGGLSQCVGWLMVLLLLGVQGWRIWGGY